VGREGVEDGGAEVCGDAWFREAVCGRAHDGTDHVDRCPSARVGQRNAFSLGDHLDELLLALALHANQPRKKFRFALEDRVKLGVLRGIHSRSADEEDREIYQVVDDSRPTARLAGLKLLNKAGRLVSLVDAEHGFFL
jgi:hypothetical protein